MDSNKYQIYFTEHVISPNASDGLDRVISLVFPVCDRKKGERIYVKKFRKEINEKLNWSLTDEVAEAILFRMEKRNLISSEGYGKEKALFYSDNSGNDSEAINAKKGILCNLFRKHYTDNPPIDPAKSTFFKDICDSDDSIVRFISDILSTINEFFVSDEQPSSTPLSEEWKSVFVSQFILANSDNEDLNNYLENIASSIFISDVVRNYGLPERKNSSKSCIIVLDTTTALSYLGTSGKFAQKNAESAIDSARQVVAAIAVLPSTIEEIKGVLKSMLRKRGHERFGVTKTAIIRGEVTEEFVQAVANDPQKFLNAKDITVLPRTMQTFPYEKEFFSDELAQEFRNIVTWTDHPDGIQHDVELLAIPLRMRKGQHNKSALNNKCLVVTQNRQYARSSGMYCLDNLVMNKSQFPVITDQTTFATLIWLKTGFSNGNHSLSGPIFQSCEILAAKYQGVFSKVTNILQSLDPDDDEQMKIMLEDRRCLDAFISGTLNDPSSINEENTKTLIENIRSQLIFEEKNKQKEEIVKIRKNYNEELANVERDKITLNAEKDGLAHKLTELEQEYTSDLDKISEQNLELKENTANITLSRIAVIEATIIRMRSSLYDRLLGVLISLLGLGLGYLNWKVGLPAFFALLLLYLLGHYWVGPFGKIRSRLEHSYAIRALKKEFSQYEMKEFEIEVVVDIWNKDTLNFFVSKYSK